MKKRSFEEWKKQVDQAINQICGLSSDDLPDQPYRDWCEDGVSPATAARRAVRYAQEG